MMETTPDRDLNPELSEFKAGAITTRRQDVRSNKERKKGRKYKKYDTERNKEREKEDRKVSLYALNLLFYDTR
jgi:hypothetical protein